MPARVQVIFWAATTASVLLLGVVWALTHQTRSPSTEDRLLLTVATAGLAVSLLVAGRIAYVIGRLRRRSPGDARSSSWRAGSG